jgi:hypothetical protein
MSPGFGQLVNVSHKQVGHRIGSFANPEVSFLAMEMFNTIWFSSQTRVKIVDSHAVNVSGTHILCCDPRQPFRWTHTLR